MALQGLSEHYIVGPFIEIMDQFAKNLWIFSAPSTLTFLGQEEPGKLQKLEHMLCLSESGVQFPVLYYLFPEHC